MLLEYHWSMTVFIGADHRGYELKQSLIQWIKEKGISLTDCGNSVYDPEDDYPDYTHTVVQNVKKSGEDAFGIVICGSGMGVCIAANKEKGIRCGLGINPLQVKHGRDADNINVLAIASDVVSVQEAKEMVEMFLQTPFSNEERHVRRLNKIEKLTNNQ